MRMPRSATRFALLGLLTATPVHSWTTISQSRFGAQLSTIQQQMHGNVSATADSVRLLGFLWSSPHGVRQRIGLGGGITWAWDPTLCEMLLPNFREDFGFFHFVGCDELKAAMHRGCTRRRLRTGCRLAHCASSVDCTFTPSCGQSRRGRTTTR